MTVAKSTGFSTFFNRHRKIFYFLFMCLLLFLLINTVALRVNIENRTVQSISSQEISTYFSHGYDISYDEKTQKHVYTQLNNDPQIHMPVKGEKINRINVYFSHKIPKGTPFQAYYSYNGEPYAETQSVIGIINHKATSATVFIPEGSYSQIRLDINASFSIDRIECVYYQTNGTLLKANFVSIAALVILSILSIVFEKRFGFYSFIKSIACKLFNRLHELFKEKKYFGFAVKIINIAALLTLVVSYFILLLLVRIASPYIVYIIIVSAIASITFLIDMFVNCDPERTAVLFLVISLITGFMFAFSNPPTALVGWDDEIHYRNVNDLHRLILNKQTLADINMAKFCYTNTTYKENPQKQIERILADDEIRISAFSPFPNPLDLYKKIGYIPSATVLLLGDLFDADLITVMVLAKMSTVFVFSMVIYWGLKRLKSGVYIFASIALVPTSVFLASVFSYDYWVTAFAGYSIAYLISELQQPDKKITRSDTLKIFGSMVLACGPKAIYCFLMIPALFMGKNKFESSEKRRKYLIFGAASFAVVLISFALPFVINTSTMSDLRGGEGVNAGEQIVYILTNPLEYARTLFKFLLQYLSLSNSTAFLVSFAYIGFAKKSFGYASIFIMIFCALLDKSPSDYLGKKTVPLKLIFFATTVIQLALVATALYISFTPVASTYIAGCQFRYILPILFFPLYAIGITRVRLNIPKRCMNLVVFGMLSLNLILSMADVYVKFLSA